MSLILYLVLLAVTGLVVGALGRLALPGPDPMGIGATILIGIGGSFLAGLVSLALFHGRRGGGLLLSVVFAMLLVYLVRRSRGGTLHDPLGRRSGNGPLGPRR